MSKRALKKYLAELPMEALQEQIIDHYDRFSAVKTYYDFVFNPKEDSLIQEAKAKVTNEYFPVRRKRPKARRSVAQKYIKHFMTLGVDSILVADFMLFNLETAQRYSAKKNPGSAFNKSMFNAFEQAVQHIIQHKVLPDFENRVMAIVDRTKSQNWDNTTYFTNLLEIMNLDGSTGI